jgi:hypothetical protein
MHGSQISRDVDDELEKAPSGVLIGTSEARGPTFDDQEVSLQQADFEGISAVVHKSFSCLDAQW